MSNGSMQGNTTHTSLGDGLTAHKAKVNESELSWNRKRKNVRDFGSKLCNLTYSHSTSWKISSSGLIYIIESIKSTSPFKFALLCLMVLLWGWGTKRKLKIILELAWAQTYGYWEDPKKIVACTHLWVVRQH